MSQTSIFQFFVKNPTPNKSLQKINSGTHPTWKLGDLVWAKYENSSYWPAIIVQDQDKKYHMPSSNQFHIKYIIFPEKISWVDNNFIQNYVSNNLKQKILSSCKDENLISCINQADKMIAFSIEDRISYSQINDPLNNKKYCLDMDDEINILSHNRKKRKLIYSEDEDDDCVLEKEFTNSADKNNKCSQIRNNQSSTFKSNDNTNLAKKSPANKGKTNSKATDSLPKLSKPLYEFKFVHQTLEWLQPNKRKDIEGRCVDHQDYDPRTLYVPPSYLSKATPALRQWWKIKAHRFDCVLFFKVGKFYELYHMDAVLSVKELGLTFMNLVSAHSGFPEISCGRFADALVQKGYRVCRVEQTETVTAMEKRRENRDGSKDKLVNREVCRIMSKGTKTFSYLDSLALETVPDNRYLLALTEIYLNPSSLEQNSVKLQPLRYGICCVDTTVGKFYIGEFFDDSQRSSLRTFITHYPPVEVLFEKGKIAKDTIKIIDHSCSHPCLKQFLIAGKEFWDASTTLQHFKEYSYKSSDVVNTSNQIGRMNFEQNLLSLDVVIAQMTDQADLLALTPKKDCALALKSLGACVWYLKDSLIDAEILSMENNVEIYVPPTGRIGDTG
ncbi:unnamed protein product [Gordionus sp. m RMFG-2023]